MGYCVSQNYSCHTTRLAVKDNIYVELQWYPVPERCCNIDVNSLILSVLFVFFPHFLFCVVIAYFSYFPYLFLSPFLCLYIYCLHVLFTFFCLEYFFILMSLHLCIPVFLSLCLSPSKILLLPHISIFFFVLYI